jgi:hypothetical protein
MFKTLTIPKLIRRFLVGLPLAALLVGAMATGVAADKPGPPPPPFPPTSCGSFDVVLALTMFNPKVTVTYRPDGTVVRHVSGAFLATLTNQATEKSIEVNASGPETDIFYPDGTVTVIGNGKWIGGGDFATMLDPNLLFAMNDGTVIWTFDSSGHLTGFSHTGHVTDLCAAVS